MRKSDVDIYLLKYNLECAIPKFSIFLKGVVQIMKYLLDGNDHTVTKR